MSVTSTEIDINEYDHIFRVFAGRLPDIIETYNTWISGLDAQLESMKFTVGDSECYFKTNGATPTASSLTGGGVISPQYCMHRYYSYVAKISGYLLYRKLGDKKWLTHDSGIMEIMSVPIMTGSKACIVGAKTSIVDKMALGEDIGDRGGHFVTNGTPRNVFAQVSLRKNIPHTIRTTKYKAYSKKEAETNERGVVSTVTCNVGASTQIVMCIMTAYKSIRTSVMSLKGKNIPLYSMYKIVSRFSLSDDQITAMIMRWIPASKRNAVSLILDTCIAESSVFIESWLNTDKLFNELDIKVKTPHERFNEMSTLTQSLTRDLFPNIPMGANFFDTESTVFEVEGGNLMNKNMEYPYISAEGVAQYPDGGFGPLPFGDTLPYELDQKLECLSRLAGELAEFIANKRQATDRDSWSNKRMENAGSACKTIFGRILQKNIDNIIKPRGKSTPADNIKSFISSFKNCVTEMNSEFIRSISITSVGGMIKSRSNYSRDNLSDALRFESILFVLSALSRVKTPTSSHTSKAEIRDVQLSQYGYICPDETPEGEQIGLVVHKAALARVTNKCPLSLEEFSKICGQGGAIIEKLPDDYDENVYSKIFMDGIYIGYIKLEVNFHLALLGLRRSGAIDREILITNNYNIIEIFTDESRMIRPLIILEPDPDADNTGRKYPIMRPKMPKGTKLQTWSEYIDKGYVEYIDPREIEYFNMAKFGEKDEKYITIAPILKDLLANDFPYTHMEPHPISMSGTVATCTPLRDHAQAPRNAFNSAMMRQALSVRTQIFGTIDTSIKSLLYASVPITQTIASTAWGVDVCPFSTNVVVAFMAMAGNQEDAIIMRDKSSKLFTMSKQTTYSTIINESAIYNDTIEFPTNVNREDKKYEFIEKDENRRVEKIKRNGDSIVGQNIYGVAKIGSFVKAGDCILVLRRVSKNDGKEMSAKQSCKFISIENDATIIDIRYYAPKSPIIHIVTRSVRLPRVGDKFADPPAQKGVVGFKYSDEDMPRIAYGPDKGLIPDIIVNPHSLPSRMTIGWPFMAYLGKVAAITGKAENITSFQDVEGPMIRGREVLRNRYIKYVAKLCGKDTKLMELIFDRIEKFNLDDQLLHLMRNDSTDKDLIVRINEVNSEFDKNLATFANIDELKSMVTYRYYSSYLDGKEIMINPRTGEEYHTPIFMGITWRMSLRHHTKDKVHVAGMHGPSNIITRQPGGGRGNDGGLRTGEMERDAYLSHGASYIVLERLMEQSDVYHSVFCTTCGTIALAYGGGNNRKCNFCISRGQTKSTFCRVKYAYIYKFLIQILAGLGIKTNNGIALLPT